MFEDLFGNGPQCRVISFFFCAPVEEYTKQQIVVGSEVPRDILNSFIDTFIEYEILIEHDSKYILNVESKVVQKLMIAQEEFIEFFVKKQLEEDDDEEYFDVSDEELEKLLSKIPDYLDFDKLEKEISAN